MTALHASRPSLSLGCFVRRAIVCVAGALAFFALPVGARAETTTALDAGYALYFNGQYASAAAFALERCSSDAVDIAACELATSALHFEIRRNLRQGERSIPWEACQACPTLLSTFLSTTARGQSIARARLQQGPVDGETRFLLAKLDLNYVWLHLGTLGRKTGLKEYREARHLLGEVLAQDKQHVRAQVARGWVDYIVATKMPRGTRWLLGGGSKDRGMRIIREAAAQPASFFVATEATFALWDMQVREKDLGAAVVTARRLAQDFPRNEELQKFLSVHATW